MWALFPRGCSLGGEQCKPGDKVLVSGTLGDHGITVMSCREGLSFSADLQSDAAPLNHLIAEVLAAAPNTRCFRDPTRGGLASTLNEFADQAQVDITIEEDSVPVKDAVRGACEMLGYDVLQVANEGKMVCVVPADEADAALGAMRANKYGVDAAIIGEVGEMRPSAGRRFTCARLSEASASSTCWWASSSRAFASKPLPADSPLASPSSGDSQAAGWSASSQNGE